MRSPGFIVLLVWRAIAICLGVTTILSFLLLISGYMMRRSLYRGLLGCVVLCIAAPSFADKLTLNDGTVIEGTVISRTDDYWVKTPDGQTRTIPKSTVKSHEKMAARFADTPAGVSGAPISIEFSAAKRTAEAVLLPDVAVAVWKTYIDAHATAPDAATAAKELAKWQKLADDGAERIGGKWIGGDEKKAMVAKSEALLKAADEDIAKNRTINAVEKLKEANKAYPNSIDVNFTLGYLALLSHNHTEAAPYFEQCLKLNPKSGVSSNNLAICMWENRKFDRAIALFYDAASGGDNSALAKNLATACKFAPRDALSSVKGKSAVAASELLMAKYNLTSPTEFKGWMIANPSSLHHDDDAAPAGAVFSGTGFLIGSDGLILTNRHVVDGAKKLLVKLDGGSEKVAEVVAIDSAQDLALIRVKASGTLPTVSFAKADIPSEGAQCFAMGFPLMDRMGASVKITQGIVSGSSPAGVGADIIVDAKVNPGNSGGPLLDKYGHVIGIVTMKSRSTSTEDSYGMAISAGHIRKFLDAHKVTVTPLDAADKALAAEDVAAKIKPATVCIIATH